MYSEGRWRAWHQMLLDTQNACLLMKLLHRLHHPGESSWVAWRKEQVDIADLHGVLTGSHWDSLRGLLPAYRRISHVQVGNGQDTSFWKDQWIGDQPLSSQLPALHSHLLREGASVEEVVFRTCNTIPTTLEPAGGNRAAPTGVHAVRCEPE